MMTVPLPGLAGLCARDGSGEELRERAAGCTQRAPLVVDQVEVPHDPEAADPERLQPAGRLLPLDGVGGHKHHAEAGQHALLDRLVWGSTMPGR